MSEPTQLTRLLEAIERGRDRLVAVVVHLNDTYLIEERAAQQLPGFPRVIATVARIREHVMQTLGCDRTLVVHSGDFLGPSRVGKRTQGKLMVELLNRLGLDYCVLGNHEFDYGESVLIERLADAQFRIVLSNVATSVFATTPYALWPSDKEPLIALAGIVSGTVHSSFPASWTFSSPADALRDFACNSSAVPFRLILTHATRLEDREFRRGMPHRSYFLGGHDHDIHWIENDSHHLLMKNLSNLQTVRVLLLSAAGSSAKLKLVRAHDALEQARISAGISFCRAVPRHPQDIEPILQSTHPVDAAVFRADLERWRSGQPEEFCEVPAVRQSEAAFDVLDASESYTLFRAIISLPDYADEFTCVLLRDDQEAARPEDLALVRANNPEEPDEDDVVCDFSAGTDGLEARDQYIRNIRTDFGMFVAECVRLKGGADIAILNAGAFRCDARLPPVLRLRELRDTFLYDSSDAIIVLQLPRNAIVAALDHGREKVGGGGYPQFAPDVVPAGDTLRVAIAAYLVAREDSIDGYDIAIANVLRVPVNAFRSCVEASVKERYSIIEAVLAMHDRVPYQGTSLKQFGGTPIDEFIATTDEFFRRVNEPVDSNAVTEMLGSDDPVNDVVLQRSRDKLRSIVRRIPEVQEFDHLVRQNINSLTRDAPAVLVTLLQNAHEKSLDRLRAFQMELSTHPDRFRKQQRYDIVLRFAARGLGGWQP